MARSGRGRSLHFGRSRPRSPGERRADGAPPEHPDDTPIDVPPGDGASHGLPSDDALPHDGPSRDVPSDDVPSSDVRDVPANDRVGDVPSPAPPPDGPSPMQGADDGDARDGDRPQTPPGVGPDTRTTDTPDAASRPDTPDMRGASSTADDDAAGDVLVTVRVPASSANLGPGYDVLGVALDLSLVVEARPFDGRRVAAAGEGEGELPADDDNLVWRAVRAFCDVFGHDVPDVTLHCDNHIPLQRGLGSSSAAAVAGLVVARALCSAPVADQDLIDLATQLEGHADNAAAAVLGGLVVAGPVGPARRFEPARSLRPVICIPQTRLATSAARALVPTQVPLPTAIASIRRSTLVVAGLSGAASWDPSAMTDDLHEPPRLAAMPASRALIEAARADGHGACLSGAGPSVLVVTSAEDDAVGRIRELAGHAWTVVGSAWNRTGALVEWTRRP